ncbi:Putative DNA ligase-like protein Rv0938/MT0965 (plasmid) [Legionella adelaidensis]|uniref:DNA ligase (ATP) n=1 Tax=Legionella adelaidensis TaxID=45056 RepID=A0A0W0R4A0_9GAMM|nr:cisplatin damage response ATP-dependent DNA ligase [Legionella adelaidensis]KTC65838.1 ATP dependent DNA ligase [Legionella adelaidensis]VEH85268.1 Putative DNA ligase-like protein Rv0938/MT0965 [Legionella adelaidensis]
MNEFAELLNNLYFTYSTLEKSQLLQNYFKHTPDPERGYALAILANTLLFPTFKRSLIKEIISNRIDPYLFSLSLDYVGDLSDTISLLWPTNKELPMPKLSEIVLTFNTINETQYASYLIELLNRGNAVERWALLKLGTGSLRVGVSSRFIKKVLSELGAVDIKEIERLWHAISPPYLELFAWLAEKLPAPVIEEKLFFHPVMLSHALKKKDLPTITPDLFALEPKYDGIRVQVVSNKAGKALFSRTGDLINASFPDILAEIQAEVVLDGELVIRTEKQIGSFNDLQQRLNRKKPNKKIIEKLPAAIILYDILAIKGAPLYELTYLQRRKQLEDWYNIHKPRRMYLSDNIPFTHSDDLIALKEQVLQDKQIEGLMLKRKDSLYIPGRPSGLWYKWKRDPFLIDAVLMYAQRGHGKRSSLYSNYTFGVWQEDQLLPVGKAYFGFTDEELHQLDHWIRHHVLNRFGPILELKKELVFEVAFDAINFSTRHKSGLALRFPRIHRIRWDKPAKEADHLHTLLELMHDSK